MTERTQIAIKLQNVSKSFGSFRAVRDVSFIVHEGDVVGFVGENGAGKTTTINMLLGFTSPRTGSVSILHEEVYAHSAHKMHAHIGYASSDMTLPVDMTGREYVNFVLAQQSVDHTERYEYLVKELGPDLDKKIGDLSRGNKQKIALLAAFVIEPKLLIFDEPTSGLDPVMQEVFLRLIREEKQRETTVFMSSHYMNEVAEVCDRVLLMRRGKLIEDLSTDKLKKHGGKYVTIVTKTKPILPRKDVSEVESSEVRGGVQTKFLMTGDTAELLRWLRGATGVQDVTIENRSLEQELYDHYDQEADDE